MNASGEEIKEKEGRKGGEKDGPEEGAHRERPCMNL